MKSPQSQAPTPTSITSMQNMIVDLKLLQLLKLLPIATWACNAARVLLPILLVSQFLGFQYAGEHRAVEMQSLGQQQQQQQKEGQQLPGVRAATAAYEIYKANLDQDHQADKVPTTPHNLHAHYPLQCVYNHHNNLNISWPTPAATYPWINLAYADGSQSDFDDPMSGSLWSGHRSYSKVPDRALDQLSTTHACRYHTLELFWEVLAKFNENPNQINKGPIRWVAHGGTAMGAYCHHSVNPWDDDIDITMASCEPLYDLFKQGQNVSDVYPDIPIDQYWNGAHDTSRLITDQLILMKGKLATGSVKEGHRYWKLKSVDETRVMTKLDLGGVDVQCFDEYIPRNERQALQESHYETVLKDPTIPLDVLPFGPTFVQSVPFDVLQKYVELRYKKTAWCDFPYDIGVNKNKVNDDDDDNNSDKELSVSSQQQQQSNQNNVDHNPRASQMHHALATWYFHPQLRYQRWPSLVGHISGNHLTKMAIPKHMLEHVEIDNSIASPDTCRITSNTKLKIVNFNAQRGTHWDKFAHMVETYNDLQQPDVIILNEMDIGMARSGNIHTTRKLAYQLGMNYAWALEFFELTAGNQEEQTMANATGVKDTLGIHGNAILSRCEIYDPKVFRDKLQDIYFSTKSSWENAHGYEMRLGGRMALFARTGNKDSVHDSSPSAPRDHIVVGSIHKLSAHHRTQVYEYFGAVGKPPDVPRENGKIAFDNVTYIDQDQMPRRQLGILAAGDFGSDNCPHYGMKNLDLDLPRRKTFPSDCTKEGNAATGVRRGDFFCAAGMEILEVDKSIPPCYGEERLQISDHAIMQIILQPSPELDSVEQ